MRAHTGQPLRWSGLAALLFLLVSPLASAQAPPLPTLPDGSSDQSPYLSLNLGVVDDQAYVFVRPGQQVRVTIEVVDQSADRFQDARNPFPHSVQLEAAIVDPAKPQGWTVTISNNSLATGPGTTSYATLVLTALYSAEVTYVTVAVNGTLTGSDGSSRVNDDVLVKAQLLPFYAGRAQVLGVPEKVGQEELVRYQVEIENQATYPDWFMIHLNATPGFQASAPERIYVPPLSKRIINLTIYTPRTGFFEWGTLGIIGIEIRSQSDPAFRFQTTALVNVQGFHVPGYWIPVTLFALVATGLIVDKRLDKRREFVARDGRPRRPEPTPRQAVLLKELKKRDPAAYKEKMAALNAVYKTRRDAYRTAVKQRRAEERRLEREQRAAAKAEKRRRKKERAEQRKAEEALERERKAKLKELAAKTAELDKVRAKEEKQQAKVDKKRRKELLKVKKGKEKELGKARKAAEKEQKAAERAAAKEARAAEKAARKGAKAPDDSPPPPPSPDEGPGSNG